MHISRATAPAGANPRRAAPQGARSRIDLFASRHDKIDIHLKDKEYQGIDDLHAARMMGYFTQHMQDQGFPWRLYGSVETGDGAYSRGEALGDLEALNQLKQGKAVLFQPMRSLQLDLSSNSLEALAAASSFGGGDVSKISKLAVMSKAGSSASQGMEIRFGEPIVVGGYDELKLLYQMYNPDEKIKAQSPTGKAAHQLSYFTQRTATSAYPWRFYQKSENNAAWRMLKALARQGFTGALVGAGASTVIALPLAFITSWKALPSLMAVGAGIGGALWGFQGARAAYKGEPLNAVEALERVLNDQEVVFQEAQIRSIPVPVMKNISWVSDHGTGSTIQSTQDLDTFFWMQNQAAKLPEAEEKPKEEKPELPRILVIQDNRSYQEHHHSGRESHLHEGDEHHHHPILLER
ncbi:MAG: hypothetical protein HY319_21450 [Armatimonadetes bacterium]|nr:hypothetical protein [Armatimonadota bacterium]